MSESPVTRINKYLSEIGYCSRRHADKLIDAGRITVNGAVPEMGLKVTGEEDICVDGKPVKDSGEKTVYLAFNKPVGIVCTTDTRVEKDNIFIFSALAIVVINLNGNLYFNWFHFRLSFWTIHQRRH